MYNSEGTTNNQCKMIPGYTMIYLSYIIAEVWPPRSVGSTIILCVCVYYTCDPTWTSGIFLKRKTSKGLLAAAYNIIPRIYVFLYIYMLYSTLLPPPNHSPHRPRRLTRPRCLETHTHTHIYIGFVANNNNIIHVQRP